MRQLYSRHEIYQPDDSRRNGCPELLRWIAVKIERIEGASWYISRLISRAGCDCLARCLGNAPISPKIPFAPVPDHSCFNAARVEWVSSAALADSNIIPASTDYTAGGTTVNSDAIFQRQLEMLLNDMDRTAGVSDIAAFTGEVGRRQAIPELDMFSGEPIWIGGATSRDGAVDAGASSAAIL